ncbi:MAG TPA: hypothetical protein VK991_03965 [Halomonas sp.]|nr:hypothetical protein [Halomonas sp.]
MPPITLEIRQAAAGRPYSESTLRNYVRAWSEIFGALPRSRPRGTVLLVTPLLSVFDKVHALRSEGLYTIRERFVHAIDNDVLALPNVAAAYSALLEEAELVGVAATVARLHTHILKGLVDRLRRLEETQRSNAAQLTAEIDMVFDGVYANLASLLGEQAHAVSQVKDILNGYAGYLSWSERVARDLVAANSSAE